jgi:hypothetical protein
VVAPAGDRGRLERLCRYALRPPIAQERLSLTGDGSVLLQLRHPWADGTTHVLFDPVEFLERLAALTPRPRVNLVLYFGVLGARAGWRARVVGAAFAPERPTGPASGDPSCSPCGGHPGRAGGVSRPARGPDRDPPARCDPAPPAKAPVAVAGPDGARRRANRGWADLMRRVFDFDVLACPRCGGRMRLLATIEQHEVVRRILSHLGLATELPSPCPSRAPPWDHDRDLPVCEPTSGRVS